jgi:hypothetical protein
MYGLTRGPKESPIRGRQPRRFMDIRRSRHDTGGIIHQTVGVHGGSTLLAIVVAMEVLVSSAMP